ncbi:MAG: GNAT family N-acetyltransferase [Limnochordia bacterium]|jgi:predicted acetyltransferase|nr:GNAT family N-acetyltransferase [Limnochordia bacterium]
MTNQTIEIRKLSIADIDQYNELLRYAFQVTEKNLLDYGWENDEIRKSKFPVLENAHVLGCFDQGSLVSQFAVYPMDMNIHSAIFPIGFITSVATYPEYSRRGLMSRLMKQSLLEMRERGQSVAILYPFSIPLYRHRGWEIISDKMTWRIRDAKMLVRKEVPGYVRRVPGDSPDLIALHSRFAKKTHGCLFRNDLAWDEYWRWDVDDTTVAIYYGEDRVPLAYMVYRIDADTMYVKEMVYINMEAKMGLLRYINAHDSMVDEVRGNNYSGESIAFALSDSDIKETIRPYIMGRIVDFELFLRQYRFRTEADGKSLTFRISDPFLEWNNRSYTVEFGGGVGELTTKPSRYEVRLSIGTVTTLLLGYKRAPDLAALGRLEASEETIELLDAAVIRKKPYISDYI